MTTMRRILIVIYDWGEEWIFPFEPLPGGDINNGIGGKETASHIHSFAFTLEMRKEEVNHNNKEEKNC